MNTPKDKKSSGMSQKNGALNSRGKSASQTVKSIAPSLEKRQKEQAAKSILAKASLLGW